MAQYFAPLPGVVICISHQLPDDDLHFPIFQCAETSPLFQPNEKQKKTSLQKVFLYKKMSLYYFILLP